MFPEQPSPETEYYPQRHDTEATDSPPNTQRHDERLWAALCHVACFSAYFTGVGLILGPLIVWLLKKDQYPLVDDQGKESLNFQITYLIGHLLNIPLYFFCVGFAILPVLIVLHVLLTIVAALKANQGQRYRYPLCLRLIS